MKKDKEVVADATENVNGGVAVDLKRSNKVTAYWAGDGIAVGVFYRTHDKLAVINSTDAAVVSAGFVMPVGTDEVPVTAQQKLEAFKNFLSINSTVFGIAYDPVDRRADQFKYPSKYDAETFKEFSGKILGDAINEVLDSVQKNVVDKMIKGEHVPAGTEVAYGIGEGTVTVTEAYGNGSLKYAVAKYPVVLQVADKQVTIEASVDLVSGQLKKPRQLADNVVMTMTGIKTLLVDNGLLPKIEKEEKKEDAAEVAPAEAQ